MLFKCIFSVFDKETYQLVTMPMILVQGLQLHPLSQMFLLFFFCLPSKLLHFASMFPGCRQPQKTDAHLLYSCGNQDNPGRSRLTVPARTFSSSTYTLDFTSTSNFPSNTHIKYLVDFTQKQSGLIQLLHPRIRLWHWRGGGAKVPASNPGVYTMGARRRLPEAKPSAAERVESLCQLLWNAEADWWGPGDSFRAWWWGSRQRCKPEQTPQGTPSPSVHTFGVSRDGAARRSNLGKMKKKKKKEAKCSEELM